MVFQTKTYASLVSALPKSISDKRAAKKRKSLAKIVYLDVGKTFRYTFLSSELQCPPRGDPRILCVNTRIQLLATHLLFILIQTCNATWLWYYFANSPSLIHVTQ